MPRTEPVRVMVVDDHHEVRFLVRVLLEEHDDLRLVAEAAGADEALAGLEGDGVDVVLLDARMPLVDGFELAPRLRARAPRVRIALLTSIVDPVVEAQARAAGVERCVSKGHFDALPDVVRQLARAAPS